MTTVQVDYLAIELAANRVLQALREPNTEPAVALGGLLRAYLQVHGAPPQMTRDWYQEAVRKGAIAMADVVTEMIPPTPPAEDHFADRWIYKGGDDCCKFFTACLHEARWTIPRGGTVLEVGCAEFDWMAEMARQCPDIQVTGIDWRKTKHGIQGDVLTYDFPPESFDAVVSISALEHIGLGHYNKDPADSDGDTKALARIWSWLKPGGVLSFDVPYNPERYQVVGTSHREYDDAAIIERLWIEPLAQSKTRAMDLWRGYSHASNAGVLCDKPDKATRPFWYVGFVWQKL